MTVITPSNDRVSPLSIRRADSSAAASAIPYVKRLAKHYEADVFAFHVRPAVVNPMTRPATWPVDLEFAKAQDKEHRRALLDIFGGVPTKVLIEEGDIPSELKKAIAKNDIDLVVLGTRGRSGLGKLSLGSIAEETGAPGASTHLPIATAHKVVSRAACPVLTMQILVATGGSECSRVAVLRTAERPWPAGSVFRVLSVEDLMVAETPMAAYSPATIYPASLLEELLADARTRAVKAVDDTRQVLLKAGLKVLDQQPVPACDPRVAILGAAEAWPADLVIVGSHGRRGLDRLLMGSVAESVAVHAKCSVEVVCRNSQK